MINSHSDLKHVALDTDDVQGGFKLKKWCDLKWDRKIYDEDVKYF